MRIPSTTRMINRALDLRGDAIRQHDLVTVAGLDILIRNLYRGARLSWAEGGELLIKSASNPGAVYTVRHNCCSCPCFGPCWHGRARELLLAMFETEAETADMAAEYH